MTHPKNILTAALALYLVLLPALVRPATAQLTPRPFDPPAGPRGGHGPSFVPLGATTTLNGFNGFVGKGTPGIFPHGEHDHAGGTARFESPWGEEMNIRFWKTHGGLAIEYDGEVTTYYELGPDGAVRELRVVTADREVTAPIGNQGELAALGILDPANIDLSAYQLVEEILRANHSEAFLEGVARIEGAALTNCGIHYSQCVLCILSWSSSFIALALACNPGGVVITFGAACLAAIVAHEILGLGCAFDCVKASLDCEGDPYFDGDPPLDCNDPD